MIKIKKVRPLFNHLVVTADKYEEDQRIGGIIAVTAGEVKEYQRVVAVGSSVRDVKAGDLVKVKFDRYMRMKHRKGSMMDGVIADNTAIEVNLPAVMIDGVEHLALDDIDIDYVVEEYEEVEDEAKSDIIVPQNKIVLATPTQFDTSHLRGGTFQ